MEFAAGPGDVKRAQIAGDLPADLEQGIIALFLEFHHLFITEHRDLKQTNLRTHRIKLRKDAKPVVHRTRRVRPEHLVAVEKELDSLLQADLIYPIKYRDWLSPIVVVIKKNGKVRMCVDYHKLNEATIKDEYPIPVIDEVLDEVLGAERISLCDGYSSYYQIGLAEEDRDKTAFTTPWGNFVFKVLSVGLKNGPADFQETMDEAFRDQKGKSIRVFFNDFCVYGREVDHLGHLRECFIRLDRARLSLNALKCTESGRELCSVSSLVEMKLLATLTARLGYYG